MDTVSVSRNNNLYNLSCLIYWTCLDKDNDKDIYIQ